MTLRTITPLEAHRLVEQGAVLIDVREAGEYARERIPGARHVALSTLDNADLAAEGKTIILHCRSGARTRSHGARLAAKAGKRCQAFVLDGGIIAWRRAGLPTEADRAQPIDMQRRVRISAGLLAVAGAVLGLTWSPWMFLVPLVAGAGLICAGVTGHCGMARLLAHAPWNRAGASTR